MKKSPKNAQKGKSVSSGIPNLPPVMSGGSAPLQNQKYMEEAFGGYQQPSRSLMGGMNLSPDFQPMGVPRVAGNLNFENFMQNAATPGDYGAGGRVITENEMDGSGRYDYFMPSSIGVNNEEVAAANQGWGEKAVNGLLKGTYLVGSTFLQGTVGAVNGLYQWADTGQFSSFYDNEFNRTLDEGRAYLEDALPNYYSQAELDADWYSPTYWMTGNFLWDGIVKNLGFAVGAYYTGAAYAGVLRALSLSARMVVTGQPNAAATLAATEKGLSAANRGAGVYGELESLSKNFLSQYNVLNPAQRIAVAGLSTQGEAGIEALHNSNEFRQTLIDEYKQEYGVMPGGQAMADINAAVEGAGNVSFWANVGVLTASNYIMFPRIARNGYTSQKAALNNTIKRTNGIVARGGTFAPDVKKIHPYLRTLNNIRPYLFSTTEALEEVSQYGISVTTKDYYNKQYNNEATSWISSMGVGLTDGVFSNEGAKNALIGGISGRIMTIRGMNRERIGRNTNTANAIRELNDSPTLSKFTQETIYSVNRAGVLGDELNAAVERGDEYAYKSLESDFIINYLTPRIKYGRYDLVKYDIKTLRDVAVGDFTQLQAEGKIAPGDTKQRYIDRLDNLSDVADQVNTLYQALNLRYGGIQRLNKTTGKMETVYDEGVINQMIYAAATVQNFDKRLQDVISEFNTALPGVDFDTMIKDILAGDGASLSNAMDLIEAQNILSDTKNSQKQALEDLAKMVIQREQFLTEYDKIKDNPDMYSSAPTGVEPDDEEEETDIEDSSVVVTTKDGERTLDIGGRYYVGRGVDFKGDTAIDQPIVISEIEVLGKNEDGTIKIKDNNGLVKDISQEELLNLKVAPLSSLENDKAAAYYFENRNKVFEFNLPTTQGGARQGRLQYSDGKMYFVYKDSNGTVLRKQITGKFFKDGIIKPVGVLSENQGRASEEYLSDDNLAQEQESLAASREARLEIMRDLGIESKRRLEEINRQIEKDNKTLDLIKKDLDAIASMQEGGETIKLTYSKASKSFTRTINRLTKMQADTQKRVEELQLEQQENTLNVEYFDTFTKDLVDIPGNNETFLNELKQQLKLLEDNGKAVNKEIAENKKLIDKLIDAAKSAAKLLKSAIKSGYKVGEDFTIDMDLLLKKAAKGEDLESTWPLLKQMLADFNLTNDLLKEVTISEKAAFEALEKTEELENQLDALRQEYKVKREIVNRFQQYIDQANKERAEQDQISKDIKTQQELENNRDKSVVIEAVPKTFDPVAKKSNEVISRSTIPLDDIQKDPTDAVIRANEFGFNLPTMERRDEMRGVYVTSSTQSELLPGVIEKMLEGAPEENLENFKKTAIAMVIVDTDGDLVGKDGAKIPEGENVLDNAIYMFMPENGFKSKYYENGSMFRNPDSNQAKQIVEEYKEWRSNILNNPLGEPFTISPSFGITESTPSPVSVWEAGLVEEQGSIKDKVIYIPTNNNTFSSENGSQSFEQPLGSVFIKTSNGYVQAQNRKHTREEAKAIYDAILTYATELFAKRKGSDLAQNALKFLRGVTYWGKPSNAAGQNSVYFEFIKTSTFSGVEMFEKAVINFGVENQRDPIDFNVRSLQANEELIITTLMDMYSNINNSYVKSDEPFFQIKSIDAGGNIEQVKWRNYQDYLLASQDPSGQTRSASDLPLYVNIQPSRDVLNPDAPKQINRRAIYLVDTSREIDLNVEEEVMIVDPADVPVLDGKTINVFTSVNGNRLNYTVSPSINSQNYMQAIQMRAGLDFEKVKKDLREAKGMTSEKANQTVKAAIYNYVNPLIAKAKRNDQQEKDINEKASALNKKLNFTKFKEQPKQQTSVEKYRNKGKVTIKSKVRKAPNGTTYNDLSVKPDMSIENSHQDVLNVVLDIVNEVSKTPHKTNIYGGIVRVWESSYIWEPLVYLNDYLNDERWGRTIDDFLNILEADALTKKAIKDSLENRTPIQLTQQTSKEVVEDNQEAELKRRLNNGRGGSDPVLREITDRAVKRMSDKNWNEVTSWMKTNLPSVPVFRVKNIIENGNGKQAWGMFQDAAMYIYENAEVGTAYHEAFEAVYGMFLDSKEKANLYNEFKQRKGTFVDRPTGKNIKFSEATQDEMREHLAEEFKDYVQYNQKPFYVKIFKQLKDLITSWFRSPDSSKFTKELFDRIGDGYYATPGPALFMDIDTVTVTDGVFSLGGRIGGKEMRDILHQMTYDMITPLVSTKRDLLSGFTQDLTGLYDKLKDGVQKKIDQRIYQLEEDRKNEDYNSGSIQDYITVLQEKYLTLGSDVNTLWPEIIEKHKEFLRQFSITFDEQGQLELQEVKSNKGWNTDITLVDNYKQTNSGFRLLLSTIPRVQVSSEGSIAVSPSSIGGVQLLPQSQTYITLLSKLASAVSITDMLSKLRDLALEDINYDSFYRRVVGAKPEPNVIPNLDNITQDHQLALITTLWKTFNKAGNKVPVVNVLEGNEVQVTEASVAPAARQIAKEFVNNIITQSRSGSGAFINTDGIFNPNPVILKKPIGTVSQNLSFLKAIGINISRGAINNAVNGAAILNEAVGGIKSSILQSRNIRIFNSKALDMAGRLMELAIVKSAFQNPEVRSTFTNVEGQKAQTYIAPNSFSKLHDWIKSISNISELAGTPFSYLLTDVFAQGSSTLKRIFDIDGNKLPGSNELLSSVTAGGIINQANGRNTKSTQLSIPQRLTQELNLNINGIYLNLVPGDSSLEWALEMGNPVTESDLRTDKAVFNSIMKDFFIAEVNLAKEQRDNLELIDGRKSTDLRFFKGILTEETNKEIEKQILDPLQDAETIYDSQEAAIKTQTFEYVLKNTSKTIAELVKNGIVQEQYDNLGNPAGYTINNVQGMRTIQPEGLTTVMATMTANYIIANIDQHKLVYGDPYQYKDELKRTKSFLSPRQPVINSSPEWNNKANDLYNRDYTPETIGYTDFTKDYFSTVTYGDVLGVSELYDGNFEETDGGGLITEKADRNFQLRTGTWNADKERQYRYNVAWEKRDKKQKLTRRERDILKEGNPRVNIVALKPIVSGARLGYEGGDNFINETVLDKFALFPISYRIMKELDPDSNMVKLYNKMQDENIDYIVFKSGRKVGAGPVHAPYVDGEFNDAPYSNTVNVPFSIMGLQSDVPSKTSGTVTRGSQVTKLVTLDLLDNSVPYDYDGTFDEWNKLSEEQKIADSAIYREIDRNTRLVNALTEEAGKQVLNRLGIERTKDGFQVKDLSKIATTLREEMFKRESNDNLSQAITGFLEGQSVLESTPAYNEVRNILYSIVQKNIVRPKISGGEKVQMPSAYLESKRAEFNEELNGYTSDILKFYENEDGERVMEIMVGRWFNSPMSDTELLEYLNNTEEGQQALRGVAYRIPTQKQNSIDVIKIKQFLPQEYSDQVIVPSAIVKKVGSDFDIDKLNLFLKNMRVIGGRLKPVPFYGIGEDAKVKITEDYDKGEFISPAQEKELNQIVREMDRVEQSLQKAQDSDSADPGNLINLLKEVGLFDSEETTLDFVDEIRDKGAKKTFIDKIYKESLENEYINSMENLITLPENFERLILPNNADQAKALAAEIVERKGQTSFNSNNIDNLLDRPFMQRLRNAFVAGKKAIGIAAIGQTSLALAQRITLFLPTNYISFKNKNTVNIEGEEMISFSGRKNAADNFISDIMGQFMDGYVDIAKDPWIYALGATRRNVSTWLYLLRAGVPLRDVAFFINQPAIQEYLQTIENQGGITIVREDIKDEILKSINVQGINFTGSTIPAPNYLRKYIGKSLESLSVQEKKVQGYMLEEFVKYAEQSKMLFDLNSGTNWDVTVFNDPYIVFKKTVQQMQAKDIEIKAYVNGQVIDAPDATMESTFLATTADTVVNARRGISTALTADQPAVTSVLHKVLLPYVNTSDYNFVRIARAATNALFDYAVQTNQQLNTLLKEYLTGKTNVAREVINFVNDVKQDVDHPLYNNEVINLFTTNPSRRVGVVPINLTLKSNDRKVYDQNAIIYGFEQLKEYLSSDSNLYNKIVLTSILQSGLNNSNLSFTSLIPYEDFQKVYNKTLSRLDNNGNLEDFYTLGMFERNAWALSNGPVISMKEKNVKTARGLIRNIGMKFMPTEVSIAIETNDIPQLLKVPTYMRSANERFIMYSWTNESISDTERREMASRGDFSFINRGLFEMVTNDNGTPYIYETKYRGKVYKNVIYKHVNALGNGFRAVEYYDGAQPSVFDNGTLKAIEKRNEEIIYYFEAAQSNLSSNSGYRAATNVRQWEVRGDKFLAFRPFQEFSVEEIKDNAPLLTQLGYSEEQIGAINKRLC